MRERRERMMRGSGEVGWLDRTFVIVLLMAANEEGCEDAYYKEEEEEEDGGHGKRINN